jgi:hypothetical protein
MAEIDLVFASQELVRIGVLRLDCAEEEVHGLEAMITEHPVEEGINISDHIRRLPYTLEISGIVTNTPIVNLEKEDPQSPNTLDTSSPADRVALSYSELNEMLSNGTIVDAITSLATYSNMVIQNRTITRNAENGNVLNVTISLRELLTAETEQVPVPEPVVTSKRQTTDRGKKTKKEANTVQTQKTQSVLSSMTDSLFSG